MMQHSPMSPSANNAVASVIVRAKNESNDIERCLKSLRAQSVPVEIIVVDSGSTDSTVDIARRYCDVLLEISPADFSYGRALNLGAEAASAPIHVALSAHCWASDPEWIERALFLYADESVAATGGNGALFDGSPLFEQHNQTLEEARRFPYWGYSNHAGTWRAHVWRKHRFNETIEACEDTEWGFRLLNDDWKIAIHPLLVISATHRRAGGARDLFQRSRKEARATMSFAQPRPLTLLSSARTWWTEVPANDYPAFINRMNYFRAAEIAGRYVGQREGGH
jgi:rhamnosyltransferase